MDAVEASLQELNSQIEKLRCQLYEIAATQGFASEQITLLSKQIDELVVEYLRISCKQE